MLQMQMVNRLQQGHVPIVFVEYGSGGVSAMLRAEGALFNHIPPTMLQTNIEMFHAIQEHFQLLTHKSKIK